MGAGQDRGQPEGRNGSLFCTYVHAMAVAGLGCASAGLPAFLSLSPTTTLYFHKFSFAASDSDKPSSVNTSAALPACPEISSKLPSQVLVAQSTPAELCGTGPITPKNGHLSLVVLLCVSPDCVSVRVSLSTAYLPPSEDTLILLGL